MFMKVLELFPQKYYLSISCWGKGLRKSTKVLQKKIFNIMGLQMNNHWMRITATFLASKTLTY